MIGLLLSKKKAKAGSRLKDVKHRPRPKHSTFELAEKSATGKVEREAIGQKNWLGISSKPAQ